MSGAFAVTAVIRARTEAPIYAGLAFGCYPALRAARLSPIDAIRHEEEATAA